MDYLLARLARYSSMDDAAVMSSGSSFHFLDLHVRDKNELYSRPHSIFFPGRIHGLWCDCLKACTRANRTIGFLRRNLHSCTPPPQHVKEAAYNGLVLPVLKNGSSVSGPQSVVLQEELESVQKRAAIFVTENYKYETGSMTGILGQLK